MVSLEAQTSNDPILTVDLIQIIDNGRFKREVPYRIWVRRSPRIPRFQHNTMRACRLEPPARAGPFPSRSV